MTYVSRFYAGKPDYARLGDLVRATYAGAGLPLHCTPCDLDWWRCNDDPEGLNAIRLWEDGAGSLVAFAYPAGDQIDLLIHPEHRAHLHDEVLAWAEGRRRAEVQAPGALLRAWAFEGDTAAEAVLEARGYERTDRALHIRARSLKNLPNDRPNLEAGYTIRHIRPDEVEDRAAAHRAAFGRKSYTAALHTRIQTEAPTYRPELDLVAVAPDGTFAAFALAWVDPASGLSLTEPVGCHPDHRRKGLTSALLSEAFRRLQEFGAHTVLVNAWDHEEAPNKLYDSAGFQTAGRNRAWKKVLD